MEREQPNGQPEPMGQEAEPTDGPRIYVASLSDYNAGILHGTWLDAQQEPDDLQAGIDRMLAESPTTKRYGEPAEEWRIDDFEGWGKIDINEFESLTTIARLADGLVTHGEAFAAWVYLVGGRDDEEINEFEDRYQGEYASLDEFGNSILDDMGFDLDEISGIPDGLRPYVAVDVAGWTRDMELGGHIATVESDRGVYVFWAN